MEPMVFSTTVQQLNDHIYAIDQEMVRSYVILGTEKAVVLDFGVSACNFLELVRSITDLPLLPVLTHADGDHTANISCFDAVYLHPAEQPLLEGYSGQVLPLQARDQLDLGGRVLEVVHLPGHTPGSIALIDAQTGALFGGDTLSYEPVYLFGRGRCVTDYRDSLELLSRLPVSTVWPAHGQAPITPDIIGRLLALTESVMSGTATGQAHNIAHIPTSVLLYSGEGCGLYH